MATKLEIANKALGLCGANRVAILNPPETTEAQIVEDFYDLCYGYCLSLHKWTFAKELTAQLSQLAGGDTVDGFERYQRPAGALVITKLFTSFNSEIPFRTDGDELITLIDVDTTSGVYCAYMKRVDEGQITGTFAQAFTYALAADICEPLTESSSKADRLHAQAFGTDPDKIGGKMGHAMMVDTRQGGQQRMMRVEECSLITQRGFYRRSSGWRNGY